MVPNGELGMPGRKLRYSMDVIASQYVALFAEIEKPVSQHTHPFAVRRQRTAVDESDAPITTLGLKTIHAPRPPYLKSYGLLRTVKYKNALVGMPAAKRVLGWLRTWMTK